MLLTKKEVHPIEEAAWELSKVHGKDFDIKKAYGNLNEPQPKIHFDLEKNMVGGWNGCKNLSLKIDFRETYFTSGELFSDNRGCYSRWLEKFDGVLGKNSRLELTEDVLILHNEKGEILEFKKVE